MLKSSALLFLSQETNRVSATKQLLTQFDQRKAQHGVGFLRARPTQFATISIALHCQTAPPQIRFRNPLSTDGVGALKGQSKSYDMRSRTLTFQTSDVGRRRTTCS